MVCPKNTDKASMSVIAIAEKMIRQEMLDQGVKRPEAAAFLSRQSESLTPGTFDNLKRGRLKKLDGVKVALNDLAIKWLQRKIGEFEHDLEIARRTASRPDSADIFAAMDALEKARELLSRE